MKPRGATKRTHLLHGETGTTVKLSPKALREIQIFFPKSTSEALCGRRLAITHFVSARPTCPECKEQAAAGEKTKRHGRR